MEKTHHELPAKPQKSTYSWATVAQKAAILMDPPTNPTARRPTARAKSGAHHSPKEDKRLFVRLEEEHGSRRLSPVKIKKLVTKRAGVAASAIIAITQVRSGLALEFASDQTSVIVPHIPLYIRTVVTV